MTKKIKLHVGYIGLTREGKRVEVVDYDDINRFPYLCDNLERYEDDGSWFFKGGHRLDIIAPHPDMQPNPEDEYVTRAELARVVAELKAPDGREMWFYKDNHNSDYIMSRKKPTAYWDTIYHVREVA